MSVIKRAPSSRRQKGQTKKSTPSTREPVQGMPYKMATPTQALCAAVTKGQRACPC
ncbi:hypothetical protein ATPR_1371 [Acetobacter tropicalis NBRC 101654]|uniref:Uncharacterized protein n=1 Tax=Acetobacter tropicalis NBRC 101654 TaxID=749388 RepID=F7VDC2_9PROT|nr:hypothetical protein ATPR_1371 [Acetobacter tropicalis NBRC 101654]